MTYQPIGSRQPVYVHEYRRAPAPLRARPDLNGAAYSVEEDVQGGLMVIEVETMMIMGVFRLDMRDFAEDMRDRLIVRKLAKECS